MTDIAEGPTVRLVAHCRRCHGWLLSARSIAAGIGPTCAIRERAEQRAVDTAVSSPTLFDLPVTTAEQTMQSDPLALFDIAS
ncbi:DUF6011 domain-containing protein [Nocardia higoensis]|uniref:DUF6011 domain-containing protein n=1 Tax=Nocardia higoensis TaxID=228599 RepID=UPI001E5BB609|nr:DUF6011 domain-containing protein [Nocardia higoensis]